MPYLPNDPNLEDNQKNQSGGGGSGQANAGQTSNSAQSTSGNGTGSSNPLNVSGQSNVASSAPNQAQGQAQPQGKSGAYANLNDYLNANSDQANQMVSQITQPIATAGDQAKSSVDSATNAFNTSVDSSSAPSNASDLINQAATDPSAFVSNANNVSQFKAMQNPYAGPTDITQSAGYNTAQSNINNVNQQLQNTGTEAGRFTLLQNQYANPTYSNGQQSLDQMLLENAPTTTQSFQNLQNQYGDLTNYLTNANTTADQYAKTAQQNLTNDNSQIQSTFLDPKTGVIPTLDSTLQSQLATYNAQQQADASAQNSLVNGDSTTQAFLNQLGLTPGQNLYNLNLQNYITDNGPATINSVATPEQAADAAAYQQLFATAPQLITDPSLAGTATSPVSFNMTKFQADQQAAQQQLAQDQSAYNSASGDYSSVMAGLQNLADQLGGGGSLGVLLSQPRYASEIAADQAAMAKYQPLINALNPNRKLSAQG